MLAGSGPQAELRRERRKDGAMALDSRSPSERMMDEIAAVASIQQLDYLAAEVVSEFGGHPDLAKLEEMLGAMRRLLEAEGKARSNGLAE